MSVNGILEGYLTIYGWQIYGNLFLLLVAVGAVLYPVARIVFDLAFDYVEGKIGPELGARTLILRLTIYGLVLVLGLIPLARIDIQSTSVQNRCGREALTTLGQHYEFLNHQNTGLGSAENAYAPLMPYLAMVLASGFNAVMYQATPCLQDLTHLNLAMNTLDFSAAEDPNALRATVDRFERECGAEAREIAIGFLTGQYGAAGQTYLTEQLERYARNDTERKQQLVYFGSRFYRELFYQPCAARGDVNTPAGYLCMMRPLRANNPVAGFPYDPVRDSDFSAYQKNHSEGMPTCEEWWSDATHGVRAQLVQAGGKALQNKVFALTMDTCPGQAFLPDALCTLLSSAIHSIEDGEEVIAEQMLLSGKRQLSHKTPELGWGGAAVAGGLFLFTDVAENVASQAAGYLVTIYLMKIGSALLQPFILMAVFMLWGLFLIIGEMRGMTLIKGMMLIFVLSILPSLWEFADYIDDQLFLALYPNAPSFSFTNIPRELLSDHSTIERILLLFVSMVFYVFFPMLMLYLIAEAGGPASGAKMTSEGINKPAQEQGGIGGLGVRGSRIRRSQREE